MGFLTASVGPVQWHGIVVSFFAYAAVHAGRKTFTNTKSIAVDTLGMTTTVAGALDAAFMLAYAFGLVLLGGRGDNSSPERLLSFSLVSMAVLQIAFSEFCLAHFAASSWGTAALFLIWIANGTVQSLAWPCCVKIVQSALNGTGDSTVFSVWACNGILGNVTCSLLASLVIGAYPGPAGFRTVFIITAALNVVMQWFVRRTRIQAELAGTPRRTASTDEGSAEEGVEARPELQQMIMIGEQEVAVNPDMSLKECVQLRGVIDYSLCHACIKAVAYAMFFWLPFYLVAVRGVSPGKAAGISVIYDLATLVGGPCCGILVEKFKRPATVIAIFVLLAAAPQFWINSNDALQWMNGEADDSIPRSVLVCIVLSGFLVGGVLNVLSAAVCAKLGGHGSTSRVTGIVDGIGSLGAAATQIAIPLLGVENGWSTVFAVLAGLLVLSAFTLFRIIKDELHV